LVEPECRGRAGDDDDAAPSRTGRDRAALSTSRAIWSVCLAIGTMNVSMPRTSARAGTGRRDRRERQHQQPGPRRERSRSRRTG
jgi:hypothetical protein